jgi:hypothetical protein
LITNFEPESVRGAEGQGLSIYFTMKPLLGSLDSAIKSDYVSYGEPVSKSDISKNGFSGKHVKYQGRDGLEMFAYYLDLDDKMLVLMTHFGLFGDSKSEVDKVNDYVTKMFESLNIDQAENTIQTYTNPFYPELEINYDQSWEFSTTVENIHDTQLLKREVLLNKGGTALKFEFVPFEIVGSMGCAGGSRPLETRQVKGELHRFRDTNLPPSQWIYLRSETMHACPTSVLETTNMDQYKDHNGQMVGLMRIYLIESDATTDQEKSQADQIVINSRFPATRMQ